MVDRPLYRGLWRELTRHPRMVFLDGPRRVGKTTLGRMIGEAYPNRVYLNGEDPAERARLIRHPRFFEEVERVDESTPLVFLDEFNRYRGWRRFLKSAFDRAGGGTQFLVAGSSRLDQARHGDSLAGRYYLLRLWPFTVAELAGGRRSAEEFFAEPLAVGMEGKNERRGIWRGLSEQSGFPEPFLSGRKTAWRRWSAAYGEQLIREDIRDLTAIKAIAELETLFELLPAQVGRPVAIPALAQGLQIAYNTVASWLATLERFFLIFSLTPWWRGVPRAVREGRKVYLFDTPRVADPEGRFENLVALELARAVSTWNEAGYGRFALHYLRTKDRLEVDFVLVNEGRPILLVEAGGGPAEPSPAMLKFQGQLQVPAVRLVPEAEGYRRVKNEGHIALVAPACQWLAGLP
ncbi:MAG: ATP-binding protein [Desulfobacterales bacterium]